MAQRTRLERVLETLGLKPAHVVAEAGRVARRLGIRKVSRTYFRKLRYGKSSATEEKILLIVATLREMTGLLLQANDLFVVEPGSSSGGSACLSVFSALHVPGDQDDQPSAAQTLERLYCEHAPLLRSTARHRYKIPEGDIDALVHDVFASFLERQPRVDDIRAFLLGAIGNASKHYWRKRRNESPLLPEHDETIDAAEAAERDRWMDRLAIAGMLSRLGVRCRETLRRYYLGEEAPAAIARRFSTSSANVFQLLHRCRKRAKEILQQLREPRQ